MNEFSIENIPFDTTPIKLLADIRYGLSTPPDKKENGVPLIRATDIDQGEINSESALRIDPEDVPLSKEPFLSEGEIIVVRSGANTGDSARIPKILEGSIVGYDIVISPTKIESRFLSWCLLSGFVIEYQFEPVMQRAAQPHLSSEDIGDTKVPVPSHNEQIKISNFLENKTSLIDKQIKELNRLISELNDMEDSVAFEAISGRLWNSSGHSNTNIDWLNSIPSNWDAAPVKYLLEMESGSTPKKSEDEFWNGDIPWFTAKDMNSHELKNSQDNITSTAVKETGISIIPPQTTLILVRGMILDHTFPVGITDCESTINQDMKALAPGERILPEYLFWLMRGISSIVLSLVEESAHGTKRLDTDRLKNLSVPVPSIDTQKYLIKKLQNKISKVNSLKDNLRSALDLLYEKRQALITKAILGQIDLSKEQQYEN